MKKTITGLILAVFVLGFFSAVPALAQTSTTTDAKKPATEGDEISALQHGYRVKSNNLRKEYEAKIKALRDEMQNKLKALADERKAKVKAVQERFKKEREKKRLERQNKDAEKRTETKNGQRMTQ